jgi:hypothetical protein
MQLGHSTFQKALLSPPPGITPGIAGWPWSPCDPTAPIMTKLRVWTTLPGIDAPIESWTSDFFSLYLGTGVRGLAVSISNPSSPATLSPGTPYTLSISIANPVNPQLPYANIQLPPSLVSVSLLRGGRMFGGSPLVATLLTSKAVTATADPLTVTVDVVIPLNASIDWVANDVTFQVRT